MKKTNRKSGFTLVELMIVAAIIAILAAIIVPLLANNRQRAIAAEGQNLLGVAASACKVYYAENGSFPTLITALPLQTQTELSHAKYFGNGAAGAGITILTPGLNTYVLSVTADATAGDLSGTTMTLNYLGTWGGGFQTGGIIQQ
jgi:prepilin-type N-terminal cleavage/methylation domain-containing protein